MYWFFEAELPMASTNPTSQFYLEMINSLVRLKEKWTIYYSVLLCPRKVLIIEYLLSARHYIIIISFNLINSEFSPILSLFISLLP